MAQTITAPAEVDERQPPIELFRRADEIFRALVRRRGADVTKEAPSCESATS
jgi:hypothetical protein